MNISATFHTHYSYNYYFKFKPIADAFNSPTMLTQLSDCVKNRIIDFKVCNLALGAYDSLTAYHLFWIKLKKLIKFDKIFIK